MAERRESTGVQATTSEEQAETEPHSSASGGGDDAGGWWRRVVAVGVVADDLSPRAISRYGGVDEHFAATALEAARRQGVLSDGGVAPEDQARLSSELSPDRVAEIHAAAAQWLLSQGPGRLLEAIAHARSAGQLAPSDEVVALTDHAGRTHLSVGDYDSARQLLEVADEFSISDSLNERADRLCQLATALDGLGRVDDARRAASRAFDLAELAGDSHLATVAAVRYALPAEWYAGDSRAVSLLQRAAALDPDANDAIALTAARAIVEMRIPVPSNLGEQQMAWVTRSSVAQPLADAALDASATVPETTRLLSLLAWRTTHRAPRHLSRRRAVSGEALDLAQRQRIPAHQVEAAMLLAVDALESGDRPRFDEALSVARWVANGDGNPRLEWQSLLLAAGAAHIDGDLAAANDLRVQARQVGDRIGSPGALGADLFMIAQELVTTRDPEVFVHMLFPDDDPRMTNPLGRVGVALGQAILGDVEDAERNLRRALRQVDEEASLLLLASRSTAVVLELGVPDIARDLIALMSPWEEHVAVDSNGWWCDGPVALALAELHHHLGADDEAHRLLPQARATARAMGDARALHRIAALEPRLGPSSGPTPPAILSDREWSVLKLMAQGMTNPEIARTLSYSTSTIRNDLSSIYRKLDVRGRPEAAARASELGLT